MYRAVPIIYRISFCVSYDGDCDEGRDGGDDDGPVQEQVHSRKRRHCPSLCPLVNLKKRWDTFTALTTFSSCWSKTAGLINNPFFTKVSLSK